MNAAAVGEDNVGFFHEVVEVDDFEWVNEFDVLIVAEDFLGDGLDFGIEVDWVNSFDVWEFIYDAFDGAENAAHGVAEVFAAMGGNEDEAVLAEPIKYGVGIAFGDGGGEGVDGSVAGDENFLTFILEIAKILLAEFGGGK